MIQNGCLSLINSVSVNDEVAAKEAAKKLTEGLDDLISAIASGSQAFENISKIISDLENGESISSLLGDISDAFDKLSTVGSESAEAITTIAANLKTIFDNVKINIDSLSSSSSLVMGGMQDMTASLLS